MQIRYVGVDLGVSSKHKASILNDKGEILEKRISFGASRAEFENFEALCLRGTAKGTILKVVMESTSIAWLPLSIYLRRKGHVVYRVKGEKVSDLRKYLKKYAKTDTIDSITLAKMPLIDEESLYPVYIPNASMLAMDRLVKQRDKIGKSLSARKNRIHSAFTYAVPRVTEIFGGEAFSAKALAFYEKYANPFKVRKLGLKRLYEFFDHIPCTRQSCKNYPNEIFGCCLNAIALYQDPSNGSCGIDYDLFQQEIQIELGLFKLEQKQIGLLDEKIELLYKKIHPSDNLRTIPGVGKKLAPLFTVSIGNANRFPNNKAFQCYTGFIPKKEQSSHCDKKGLHMTKKGGNLLKKGLFIAADSARKVDVALAKIYCQQMTEKGNHHYKAVCAVGTHLAARILKVYKEDRPYILYDQEGKTITRDESIKIIAQFYTVPEGLRKRLRTVTKNKKGERKSFKTRAETKLTLKRLLSPLPEDNIQQYQKQNQEVYAAV